MQLLAFNLPVRFHMLESDEVCCAHTSSYRMSCLRPTVRLAI